MMAVLVPHERQPFSPDPLRAPTLPRYFIHDHGTPIDPKAMRGAYLARDWPSLVASKLFSCLPFSNFTPTGQDLPLTPTNLSSQSLIDELMLPSCYAYSGTRLAPKGRDVMSGASEGSAHPPWSRRTPAADDMSVEEEPCRNVDYLSHEWREEDLWASWCYITARRSGYSNGVRLENASWRTWAKAKHNLGTVPPGALDWLKDCDVTWLYGPLKTSSSTEGSTLDVSPSLGRIKTPSFHLDRKPILKKKTASETMLQRSLSRRSRLQHTRAILEAQEAVGWAQPALISSNFDLDHACHRTESSTYSMNGTLTTVSSLTWPSEQRHVRFNDEVEQCIAVEVKEGDEEDWPATFEDGSSSDDGVVMVRPTSGISSLGNRGILLHSLSSDGKTITPLPPASLNYQGDSIESKDGRIHNMFCALRTPTLSPTPLMETLRAPSQPASFLLDEDDEDWSNTDQDRGWYIPKDEEGPGHRPEEITATNVFMPRGEGEGEGEAASDSPLGRVVNNVNTARDIAHVIYDGVWRQ
ncbi:hypothetical protein N7451_012010 [Penicillium sp. IBT 35674x]|nr:hypothetical protein N7451_012010 [Penicillium sp. IBT 35674x]